MKQDQFAMSEYRKTYEGGLFFITLTIVGWIDVLNRPIYLEEIAKNLTYCQEKEGLQIYAYVIMPSHIHLVAARKDGDLTELIGRFKSYTAKRILKLIAENSQESRREWLLYLFAYFAKPLKQQDKYMFWQKTNHPVGLWSNEVIDQKVDYIHNNPVVAQIVTEPQHYYWSSANPLSPIRVLAL